MADLTITAADVAIVKVIDLSPTTPALEAVDAGEALYIDATTGKPGLADQDLAAKDAVAGIAISSANAANAKVTYLRKGLVNLGDALAGLDYDDPVYLSATAGKLADADPGNTIVVGYVYPAWGYPTADKLLRLDL